MEEGEGRVKMFSNPDNFLHHFFKKSIEAIDFLEHMIRVKPDESSQLVYNSLLEHFLQNYGALDNKCVGEMEDELNEEVLSNRRKKKDELKRKILYTLKSPSAKYNSDHVLVMCQLHDFHPGTLFLYEKKIFSFR